MTLFKNKYRIESIRLPNWDYTSKGAYFITICTQDKIHYFGEIKNGKMDYSPIGAIADVLWYEIKHRTKNIELGEFVVMPNHIHVILIIKNAVTLRQQEQTLRATQEQRLRATSPTNPSKSINQRMASISPKSGSVSTIIRSYKSAVTKHANRIGLDFKWQTRFHDIIIRNQGAFDRISKYILDNPKKWERAKLRRAKK